MSRIQHFCFTLVLLVLLAISVVSAASNPPRHPRAVAGSVEEKLKFQELLNSVEPASLHDILHHHLKDKYQDGVYKEDKAAMEGVHQSNVEVAYSLLELAKRQAPTSNVSSVTVIATTQVTEAVTTTVTGDPPPPTTSTPPSSPVSTTIAPPPPPPSSSTSPPPPQQTTTDQPPPPANSPTTSDTATSNQAPPPVVSTTTSNPSPPSASTTTAPPAAETTTAASPSDSLPANSPTTITSVDAAGSTTIVVGSGSSTKAGTSGSLSAPLTTGPSSLLSSLASSVTGAPVVDTSSGTNSNKSTAGDKTSSTKVRSSITQDIVYTTTFADGAKSTITSITVVPADQVQQTSGSGTKTSPGATVQTNLAAPIPGLGMKMGGFLGALGMVVVGAL